MRGVPITTYNSILSPGVVVTGGTVNQSVLSPACYVDDGRRGLRLGAAVRASRSAPAPIVRNAIIDKNVIVPPGARDRASTAEDDLARGFVVDEGLTVLAKDQEVPAA